MTRDMAIDLALENVAEISEVINALDADQVEWFAAKIDSHQRVVFFASGRSLLMSKAIAMRLMHLGIDAHVAGDVATPGIRNGDLLVVASARLGVAARSAMEKAASLSADLFVLTVDKAGAEAFAGESVLEIPVRTRIQTAQHAGSLFEQAVLVTGDAVCRLLQARRGVPTEFMDARHANV